MYVHMSDVHTYLKNDLLFNFDEPSVLPMFEFFFGNFLQDKPGWLSLALRQGRRFSITEPSTAIIAKYWTAACQSDPPL